MFYLPELPLFAPKHSTSLLFLYISAPQNDSFQRLPGIVQAPVQESDEGDHTDRNITYSFPYHNNPVLSFHIPTHIDGRFPDDGTHRNSCYEPISANKISRMFLFE